MANFVVKQDGTKEPFVGEKITAAVSAAAKEAGYPEEKVAEVAAKVVAAVTGAFGEKEEVSSTEIKVKVLSELDTLAPEIADAWREYDKSK